MHQHIIRQPGESRPFHFETRWRVDAEAGRVWEVLSDIPAWPTWWPGMHRAHVLGNGDRALLVVQSPLGSRLRFTLDLVDAQRPRSAEFTVTGDLRGTGSMTLQTEGTTTLVTITWCVATRRRLIGALRPIAARSHGLVMLAGQHGLRGACGQPGRQEKASGRRLMLALMGTGALLALASGLLAQRKWSQPACAA